MEFVLIILCIVLLMTIMKKNNQISDYRESIEKIKNELEVIKNKQEKIKEFEKDLVVGADVKIESIKLDNQNEEKTKDSKIVKKIIDINDEKSKIYEQMEYTNDNILVTGKAGTGKSYLLKYFRKNTKKRVLYTAPTGIAALNIEGVTLHSAFGFNNLIDENPIKLSSNKKEMFKNIDTLVIDEISMVRVDVFNQIDRLLKIANNNNNKPFGGKQVILFGDLFQLPPVAKKEEIEFLTDKYGEIFFFNSPAYKSGNFIFKELEEIFRQTDTTFINILNNIREGNVTNEVLEELNTRYFPKKDVMDDEILQIVPRKFEANYINTKSLERLNGEEYVYKAKILIGDNEIKEDDFPCDFELKLKIGAVVMMITNDLEYKRWVNGSLGVISKLGKEKIVVTINNRNFEISPVAFNRYRCEYNREEKKLEYIVEASVSQYPLILAYAITIHKSQGQTYQEVACNLDSCFASGQAYVALSRCSNFEKLYLMSKVTADSIFVNKTVVNFYNEQKMEIG